jgi:hypothetical protein
VLSWEETVTGSRRAARLACAAVAGVALAAGALAGGGGAAQARVVVPPPLGSVRGGIISTIEGGTGGPGPATSVAISPCGMRSAGGWLYIGDSGSMVRRVSTATGALTTVAGDNAEGPLNRSGTAAGSALSGACSTVLDGAGNLVVTAGSRVMVAAARSGTFYGRHMTAGHIYPVAGTGTRRRNGGADGDGGPATRATLFTASDVAFDQAGNLLIADSGQPANCNYGIPCSPPPLGSLVRVVAARTGAFYGQQMTAGDIYTVAGVQAFGPAGGGGPATQAWLGTGIGSVRPDRAGNLVLADGGDSEPYGVYGVLAPSVQVIAAVTGTFYGMSMTAGHIYRVAGNGQAGDGGDGGPATAASLAAAGSAVPDGAGNLVIGDDALIRVVAARTGTFYGQQMTAGCIYAIAGTGKAGYSGDGGPASRAEVASGTVAVDGAGNVLLADGSRMRAVAARRGTFYGRKMSAGDIYTVAGNGRSFSGGGGPPLRAELGDPGGVSLDGAGDIAFTAVLAGVNTSVDLIAARSGTFFGRRLTARRVYVIGGDGIGGFRGDGGPARHAEFCISGAAPVAFDRSGNLLVADGCNNRVRLIAVRSGRFYGRAMTAGDVYTIAGTGGAAVGGDGGPAVEAGLNDPYGVAVDHHGNVLIAGFADYRVWVIAAATGTFYGRKMTVGHIYTIAGGGSGPFRNGGPALSADLIPQAVATDAAGNVIITDFRNDCVRLVAVRTARMYGQRMTVGHIYTIAGGGSGPFRSGGPASKSSFAILGGVTTDRHGNVVFTDWVSGLVWVLAVRAGTYYGQAMTVGHVYAVAGGGTALGDGGPAARALLGFPFAVAVSPAGSLLVSDASNNRLRAITP